MRVCFIGACGHHEQALRYLRTRKDVEICGFAPGSIHENRTYSIAKDIPFYENYAEMLESLKPDLAVVSPVFALTGRIIIECANRGINVFSEKPVASSLEELELVEKAVKNSGIKFSAMHYLRYEPAFYHGARLVRNGEIGEVRMVTAQKSYKFATRPDWYYNRSLYGGTIPWVGIHAIDWIYHFTQKNFISVSSQSYGNSPEMAGICQFKMEDDVLCSVNIDYYRPAAEEIHGDDRIRVVGTKGTLEVRDSKIYLANSEWTTVLNPTSAPELLEEFIDGKVSITPDEIFYITKVVIAARDSADTGMTIEIGD